MIVFILLTLIMLSILMKFPHMLQGINKLFVGSNKWGPLAQFGRALYLCG